METSQARGTPMVNNKIGAWLFDCVCEEDIVVKFLGIEGSTLVTTYIKHREEEVVYVFGMSQIDRVIAKEILGAITVVRENNSLCEMRTWGCYKLTAGEWDAY
jgi:hypothetical protein